MKKVVNRAHIEGYLYDHTLAEKVSGEQSKTPGTHFISGEVRIATDDALTNVVSVFYRYSTAKTSKGNDNATYGILKDIIDGKLKSIMSPDGGKDVAAKLRVDSAIGLNDFYVKDDETGEDRLASSKRCEGGFMHVVEGPLNEDEKLRNTFEVDMLITGLRIMEANEERGYPEKGFLQGSIFNYNGSTIMPLSLSILNEHAIAYFQGLEPSEKTPIFTRLKGRIIGEVARKIEEKSAWGEISVREVPSNRKDFIVTWSAEKPYEYPDADILAEEEVKELNAAREVYLAAQKQRYLDYQKTRATQEASAFATTSTQPTMTVDDFGF